MQAFRIEFDDGHSVEVELKSRDMAKAERLGIVMDETKPTVWTYRVAHLALQRMKRNDQIDFELPATPEALEESADIELIEDEGEGSGQEAATG